MKLLKAEAGVNDGKAGLLSAAGLFAKGGIFDKKSESFNIHELDPYLLFDAQSSMLGTLEAETLDLDPATPSTLDVITATRSSVATRTLADGRIALAEQDTVRVDYTQGEQLTPTVFQHIKYTDFSGLWSTYTYGGGSLTKTSGYASPEGNNDAHKFDIVVGTGGVLFTQNATILNSQDYTLSVWLKGEVGGEQLSVHLKNTSSSGVAASNDFSITNEWQRYEWTVTSDDTNRGFQFRFTAVNGVSDQTLYIWGPQLEEGTTASSFVANTTGSPLWIASPTFGPRVPMILVEPSATNLFTYSEDATQWTGSNRTVTPNTTTAPDGNQTAATIVRTAGSGDVRGTIQSVSAGLDYSLSIFAKADTDALIKLDVSNSVFGSGDVTFNARTGEQTAGDTTKVSVEMFPNGWRRFVFTPTCAVTGTSSTIIRLENDEPVQLWGFQFEEGSVTSYIPTSGSTVTRAADDLVISGSDFTDFFNASEGTVYVEAVPQDGINTSPYYFEFSNGTTANRHHAYRSGVTSNFYALNISGSTIFNVAIGSVTLDSLNRISYSYKTDDYLGSSNGATPVPKTGAVPTGISQLLIGNSTAPTPRLMTGRIKRLIYWPTHSDNL